MSFLQKKQCSGKSAGAIIKNGKKILLLNRAIFPFGWAGPAGHIEKKENPAETIIREVKEEIGLKTTKLKLLFQRKRISNRCSHGTRFHDWWTFECKAEGKIKLNKREAKEVSWFLPGEIKKLKLEPIWEKWFKILKII